jgi:hypothetical protein
MIGGWSRWRRFPNPRRGEYLIAPFGPGLYDVRLDDELVCFGISRNVAHRMSSLLPAPVGCGTRMNEEKRRYIQKHLGRIEYRTKPCITRHEAAALERLLPKHRYRFPT